jgi:3-hydroxybutyryl-CoA dehydrogenase
LRPGFVPPGAKHSGVSEIVLVVGGGTMGAGIAFVAAAAGFDVELVEPDANVHPRIRETLRKSAERAADLQAADRVTIVAGVPSQSAAMLAIEAVPERLELKRSVLFDLASALPREALLATNTSSLAIGELADGIPGPERVIGMHFFNPPAAMKLVEIVCGQRTSDTTIEKAYDYVARFGKTAVLAADTPGFVVNRVARPFYLQALHSLERGVASVEELDELARGAGFRMGPFELMDLIGLDINLATSESLYQRLDEERLAPVQLQRDMVNDGRLGRKSGAGFYDYANGGPQHDDTEPPAPEINTDEAVVVVGFGPLAEELFELLSQRYANTLQVHRDDQLDQIPQGTTMAIDVGDGTSDRSDAIAALDTLLPPETVLFVDAYATDVKACARGMRHPERLIGYGILGALDRQRVVEVVDMPDASDDALVLAQELFEALGRRVVLVEDAPGLFLGRTIGSIVNEAVIAVEEDVASADDVDTAMRLGTNYPVGPIAWGREIGGARITRILHRLAAENPAFAPHRALWVLDISQEDAQPELEEIARPAL